MKKQIFISTSTFAQFDPSPLSRLKDMGFDYALNPLGKSVTAEEIVTFAKDAVGLIAGTEPLSGDVLKQLGSLKVISRCGVGVDNVDLKVAKELGIKVFTTPKGPTIAVAELVVGLILNLLRNVSVMDRQVHQGQWKKSMGVLFSGKNLGIIGLGQIGKAVAKLSQSFGAKIFYYDPAVSGDEMKNYTSLSLNELLKQSDIVTLHLSSSANTHHLIKEEQFAMMKNGVYLLNCARGGVVSEDALFLAIKSGKVAGAAIDVFEKEPYHGPLQQLEQVILTPHIGSYAKEARIQMEIDAVENLIEGFK